MTISIRPAVQAPPSPPKQLDPTITNRPHAKGIGFNGFDWRPYEGFKVVPKDTALDGALPTIARWRGKDGADHQTHLLARDLGEFGRQVKAVSGFVTGFEKATPGFRWVPSVRGDF